MLAIIAEAAIPSEFDWSISFGSLLTMGTIVVAVTLYVSNMRATSQVFQARLKQIDDSMQDFRSEIKKLQEVVINQAMQSMRLDNMEQRALAQGKRVDDVTRRLDDFLDRFGRSSLSPMQQGSNGV